MNDRAGEFMVSMRWSALVLGVIIAMAVVATGFAQDKLAEIKARQDFMKTQGADLKAVSEYAKGQASQAVALNKANDLLARDASYSRNSRRVRAAPNFRARHAPSPNSGRT
jgi:cytochrome c556